MSTLAARINAKNQAKGLNAFVPFDGMGCAMLGFVAAGVKINKYYASEIEPAPIAVVKHNWGDKVTHVGDITKWSEWDIDWATIDIIIGGSPCQSFSMAGKRTGMATKTEQVTTLNRYLELRAQGIEFEGQSHLFWVYVEIYQHIKQLNPDVLFLLENVKMTKKWEDVISDTMGVAPVLINSAKVSAQNRERLYWTNISFDRNIKDRGIMLADILDLDLPSDDIGIAIREKSCTVRSGGRASPFGEGHDWDSPYIKTDKLLKPKNNQDKASYLTAGAHSGGNHSDMDILIYQYPRGNNKGGFIDTGGKSPTMTGSRWEQNCKVALGAREVGHKLDKNGKRADNDTNIKAKQRIELRDDLKSNCMTTVAKDSLVAIPKHKTTHTQNYMEWENEQGNKHQQQRAFYTDTEKTGTLPACKRGDKMNIVLGENQWAYIIRRFTLRECCALQTVPFEYIWNVPWKNRFMPKTHLYKMLGNGWTIEIIAIILRGISNPQSSKYNQPTPHSKQFSMFEAV